MNPEVLYIAGAVVCAVALIVRVTRKYLRERGDDFTAYDTAPVYEVQPVPHAPMPHHTARDRLPRAEARTAAFAALRTDCEDCGMDHVGDICPTGVCSAHRYGENPDCQTCYPPREQLALPAGTDREVDLSWMLDEPVSNGHSSVLERAQRLLGDPPKPTWTWNGSTWDPPADAPDWLEDMTRGEMA